ncbi:MAG: AMP-binding protein [Deltaproteobacteria bacterium]|nr:AMP-binding protein [Deltaproteobacteria bacterium]
MLCVNQGEISHVVSIPTSGTTGSPKQLYFTAQDQESSIEMFVNSMSQLIQAGDVVSILLPASRPGGVGDLLAQAISRLRAQPIRYGHIENLPNALESLISQSVVSLVGLPAHALALTKYYQIKKYKRKIRLSRILLCADYVSQAIKDKIAEIWGCQVFSYYGLTEAGFGGGMDCQANNGYHLHEADLYFEIIDPISGRPKPDGQQGEVVISTLTRRGMPLFRYRTGDLSALIVGSCPCGSITRRLATIRERMGGPASIGSDRCLTIADLDEALFPIFGLVDFSATIQKQQDKTRLEIITSTLSPNSSEKQVRQSLSSIPAICGALKSGILDLTIKEKFIDNTISFCPGKRIIYVL